MKLPLLSGREVSATLLQGVAGKAAMITTREARLAAEAWMRAEAGRHPELVGAILAGLEADLAPLQRAAHGLGLGVTARRPQRSLPRAPECD